MLPPQAKEVPPPGAVVAQQELALVAGAPAALASDVGDERHLGLVEHGFCADEEEERYGAGLWVREAVAKVAAHCSQDAVPRGVLAAPEGELLLLELLGDVPQLEPCPFARSLQDLDDGLEHRRAVPLHNQTIEAIEQKSPSTPIKERPVQCRGASVERGIVASERSVGFRV